MVAVAVAATGWAWLEPTPALEATDAVAVAEAALSEAGVDATVDPDPGRGTYTTSAGQEVEVWKVLASVGDGLVAIWVAVDDGMPVFLDDRAPGGEGQVLPDHAVASIADHRANPVRDRRIGRNLAATLAALVLAAAAVQLATRGVHRRPDPHPT